MHSATHRMNHDFGLRYFMAGSCHTPDAAWTALYAQKIDMEAKLLHGESQKIDREIQALKAERLLSSNDPMEKLEGKKILAELKSSEYIFRMNIEGARAELAEIVKLMRELEPLCKYSHLPVLERNEICQREEWFLELIRRAENNILAYGTIPPDQLDTMRNHPDFTEKILPVILDLTQKIKLQSPEKVFRELTENTKALPYEF